MSTIASWVKPKNDQLENAPMVWPSELVNAHHDYLQIDVEKFTSVRNRQRRGTSYSSSGSNQGTSINIGSLFSISLGINLPGWGSSLGSTTGTRTEYIDSVLLPIPEQLQYSDQPQWGETAVGILGRFAPDLAKSIAAGDNDEITTNLQALAATGKIGIIKSLIQNLGADPNAITQNIGGKIMNPYMEQVFNGIGLRNFSFTWTLVPKNRREQISINRIIKFLRAAALPETNDEFGGLVSGIDVDNQLNQSGVNDTDRWLTVPKLFNLSWRHQGREIESVPKIKKCACKGVTVNYTPNNVWATHMLNDSSNPQPVAYNIQLSFGETEIITSSDIGRGY